MKKFSYVVEVCYGNHNEWSDEVSNYCDALKHARKMSEMQGVSEARIWCEDELINILVEGDFVENYEED